MNARITISYFVNEFTFERSHYSAPYEKSSGYKYIPINGKNIYFLTFLFCFSWQAMFIWFYPNFKSWDFPSMSVISYCSIWSSIKQTQTITFIVAKITFKQWSECIRFYQQCLIWSEACNECKFIFIYHTVEY